MFCTPENALRTLNVALACEKALAQGEAIAMFKQAIALRPSERRDEVDTACLGLGFALERYEATIW